MATIGEPPIVFLDEPSAGMDPVARRFMWKVVQNIADTRKKSVVILTTHSMDEAEALCSRIAIQVDGMFRCLGSAQQIKSLYGQGLELNVRLRVPSQEDIDKWCQTAGASSKAVVDVQTGLNYMIAACGEASAQQLATRQGCILVAGYRTFMLSQLAEWAMLEKNVLFLEQFLHQNLSAEINGAPSIVVLEKTGPSLRYRILPEALQGKFKSLGVLFQLLQDNQVREGEFTIEDFQVSQASLEQIFNMFAAGQIGMQQHQEARAQASMAPAQAQAEQSNQAVVVGKPAGETQMDGIKVSGEPADVKVQEF
eukprot:TRINITY_DN109643_c0_g1_i1.p1 TRINITY_DN109643_c0_g1~~TRINITY_DN109643_c0_g1_i1.p1  ORF type:complete len:332 (+),score=68.90 TRINITY_DN109643_c0_g1_i1:69-998(+)